MTDSMYAIQLHIEWQAVNNYTSTHSVDVWGTEDYDDDDNLIVDEICLDPLINFTLTDLLQLPVFNTLNDTSEVESQLKSFDADDWFWFLQKLNVEPSDVVHVTYTVDEEDPGFQEELFNTKSWFGGLYEEYPDDFNVPFKLWLEQNNYFNQDPESFNKYFKTA